MLNSGMSLRMALGMNFASACAAFVGLYIGIVLSVEEEVQLWIFTIAAGMFLYVALANMVSLHIIEPQPQPRSNPTELS